LWYT
jgi:hypothetical protein